MKLPFGTPLTHKLIAAGAVALLASGAAVGAFASQDKLTGQTHHVAVTQIDSTATATVTATATGTETATATGTSTTTATVTPTGTETPSGEPEDAHHGDCTTTTTATATDTPTATSTPTTATVAAGGENDDGENDQDDNQGENDNHDCDVEGIPATNPNHQPEATPGVCHKGETVIKTTPSGEQVNVPCHADNKGHGDDGGHD